MDMFESILTTLFVISLLNLQAQFPDTPSTVALFMEGEVSTNISERDMAISPDGNEMYYTLLANQNAFSTILFKQKISSTKWSAPEVVSFSGRFSDLEPAFSADGKKLFFSSNRPITGSSIKDYDLWYVEKVNGKWSEPRNIGSPINTEKDEFYPSTGSSGNLYFTAAYEKGVGKEDIYIAEFKNGSYADPIALDTAVNSKLYEFNAFISLDEKMIFFTSYGRKDDKGGGDLYVSIKNLEGKWQPAKNITMLNTKKLDYCPYISPDKKSFFFSSSQHTLKSSYDKPVTYHQLVETYNRASNGSENIYWVSLEKLLESLK
jgi:Tol biopolymer transport system component